jgi:hypothetical protein
MKDLMRRVESFITFDFTLNANYISAQFATTHNYYKKEIANWSTNATKQKVIASYWTKDVLSHFAVLFGLPALLMFLKPAYFNFEFLPAIFVAALITFPVMLLFHYWPGFHNRFLPYLETVKETFENSQREQVEKCRQAQLANFSLALFFYVVSKINSLKLVQCNDQSSALLMKLYGVDPGSLKKNLELILIPMKRKSLTERRITELRNRFEETFRFMEELQFAAGIEELKKVEQQFFSR